jgi:3-hydroxybutyryl-CoA dehydratase
MSFEIGDKYTKEFVPTEAVHQSFIDTYLDCNPLHTDEAFAIAHGFEGRVMHGNILNGFLSYFIGEMLPVKNVIIHSQEIAFMNPVYMDDVLQFTAEVKELYESVNAVVFKYKYTNKKGKTVAKGKIQIGLIFAV